MATAVERARTDDGTAADRPALPVEDATRRVDHRPALEDAGVVTVENGEVSLSSLPAPTVEAPGAAVR